MSKINRDLVLHYLNNYLPIIREIDYFYSNSDTTDPIVLTEYEFKKRCILAIDNLYRTIPLYESELLRDRFIKGLSATEIQGIYRESRTSYYSIQKNL